MALRTLREWGIPRCVLYDDELGEIVGDSESAPSGSIGMLGGECIASYVDDGRHLILQIGSDKFDLDDGEAKAYGHYDYDTNMATFRITQGERQHHIQYEGWWVAWGFGESEVIASAGLHEFEDPMGWVWRVLRDPKDREDEKRHLLSLSCS